MRSTRRREISLPGHQKRPKGGRKQKPKAFKIDYLGRVIIPKKVPKVLTHSHIPKGSNKNKTYIRCQGQTADLSPEFLIQETPAYLGEASPADEQSVLDRGWDLFFVFVSVLGLLSILVFLFLFLFRCEDSAFFEHVSSNES